MRLIESHLRHTIHGGTVWAVVIATGLFERLSTMETIEENLVAAYCFTTISALPLEQYWTTVLLHFIDYQEESDGSLKLYRRSTRKVARHWVSL
jgi:hypothetical protein